MFTATPKTKPSCLCSSPWGQSATEGQLLPVVWLHLLNELAHAEPPFQVGLHQQPAHGKQPVVGQEFGIGGPADASNLNVTGAGGGAIAPIRASKAPRAPP